MMHTRYAIALGSNRRHGRFGAPKMVLAAAIGALEREGLLIGARSPIIETTPIGPSRRRFANAVMIVETKRNPQQLLALLQHIERAFGRTIRGQRWAARVLDLDIILWTGGVWCDDTLTIPHPLYRQRQFVIDPLHAVAPRWRDPLTGFSIRHLKARLDRHPIRP
jgi:2-amino-4-hydroxy-6-hydroxymethyldihydropteridine diphosphokinase